MKNFVLTAIVIVVAGGSFAPLLFQQTPQGVAAPDNQSPTPALTYAELLKLKGASLLSEEQRRAKVVELSQLVETAYQTAESLSCYARLVQFPAQQVRAVVKMAPARLKAEVCFNGDVTASLILTLNEEGFQEFRRLPAGRKITTEYVPPEPSGTKNIVLREGIEDRCCLLGGIIQSWIGPETFTARIYKEKIAAGEFLGKTLEDGLDCDVVMWQRVDPPYRSIHVFYISPDHFVIRWDGFAAGDDDNVSPVLVRIQQFKNLQTGQKLPPETWQFVQTQGE